MAHRFHPKLGWELRPNFEYQLTRNDEFSALVSHNDHGMRGGEVDLSASKKRIAVLGDSFAYGFGVRDHEVFTSLIDLPDYTVMNFGVSAYGADQLLIQLINKVSLFKPDLVIYLHSVDTEIRIARRYHIWFPKPYFFMSPESGRMTICTDHIGRQYLYQSDIVSSLKKRLLWLSSSYREGIKRMESYGQSKREVSPISEFRKRSLNYDLEGANKVSMLYRHLEYLFGQVSRFCARMDSDLLFVIGTSKYQYSDFFDTHSRDRNVKIDRRLPNDRVSKILDRLKVEYIDLFPIMEEGGVSNFFEIDAHWNAFGHEVVSEAINEYCCGRS